MIVTTEEMVKLIEHARGSRPLMLSWPHHNNVDEVKNPWAIDALKAIRDEAVGQLALEL